MDILTMSSSQILTVMYPWIESMRAGIQQIMMNRRAWTHDLRNRRVMIIINFTFCFRVYRAVSVLSVTKAMPLAINFYIYFHRHCEKIRTWLPRLINGIRVSVSRTVNYSDSVNVPRSGSPVYDFRWSPRYAGLIPILYSTLPPSPPSIPQVESLRPSFVVQTYGVPGFICILQKTRGDVSINSQLTAIIQTADPGSLTPTYYTCQPPPLGIEPRRRQPRCSYYAPFFSFEFFRKIQLIQVYKNLTDMCVSGYM